MDFEYQDWLEGALVDCETGMNAEIRVEEVKNALIRMPNGKAVGLDGIPIEV